MVLNRDGYNLVLWHFSAGNLGLSWQQVEASHQIGVSQKAWDLVLRKYILGIVTE